MPNCLRSSFLLVLVAVVGGCSLGDFYEKEYVLYEPTPPAATGSPARAAETVAPDPEAEPPADDAGLEANVARIFVLENLRDELDRAIAAGIGDVDALQRKRQDVEREIAWRSVEAGDALVAARAARVEALLGFPVVVR